MELKGKRLILGITGGIAAYKSCELTRLLKRAGADVQVAMTAGATRFIAPLSFQALSGQPVLDDQWATQSGNGMAHIDASRQADCIIVAPASADFLAKVAHGLADDLLSTLVLARNCPLLLAPAMNREMWANAATQRNVRQLKEDDITLLGPAHGEQACGETGPGRMLEAEELLEEIVAALAPKPLRGRKLLLTAGPTFEAIDPVRGITNLSSGKMGYAIARAAYQAGAEVTLISGPTALPCPRGVKRIAVRSALDMHQAVLANVADQDIFIAVAAVADYRVANMAEHKLKKDHDGAPAIELIENPDILASVAALPAPPFCVGFAAESQHLEEYAQHKRKKKHIPLIAANLIQEGFGGEDNRLILIDDNGAHPLTPAPKYELARQLIAHIAKMTGAA